MKGLFVTSLFLEITQKLSIKGSSKEEERLCVYDRNRKIHKKHMLGY